MPSASAVLLELTKKDRPDHFIGPSIRVFRSLAHARWISAEDGSHPSCSADGISLWLYHLVANSEAALKSLSLELELDLAK